MRVSNYIHPTGMVVYQAGRGAESLRCKIYGEYGGLPPIPFPGDCPNVDACSDMVYQNSTAPDEDGLCPVETGEVLHYKLSIYIDPSYPQVLYLDMPYQTSANLCCVTDHHHWKMDIEGRV